MRHWIVATLLAACWPLMGAASGLAFVRVLRLPSIFLAPLVFAAGSAVAYILLWLYFISPGLGKLTWALLILINVTSLAAFAWPRRHAWRSIPVDACVPFALTAVASLACLSYLSAPGVSPPKRFTLALPLEDHLMPQLLADRFEAGIRQEPRPVRPLTTFALTTQTSDRPPLQAAVALAVRPSWGLSPHASDFAYQTIGTLCQVTVLPALMALITALGLSAREKGFIIVAVVCSGFFTLNTVYPWPKLYAAGLLLTAIAVVVHSSKHAGANRRHGVAVGALVALSLLAHGSPVFTIMAAPLALASSTFRSMVRPRAVLWACVSGGILLGPWLVYQRCFDPPGTRLLKIHLAGVLEPDERGVVTTMLDAYRASGPERWLAGRLENVRVQGFEARLGVDWVGELQQQQFFRFAAAFGTIIVGLLALPFRRHSSVGGLSICSLTAYAAIAWALWLILLFPPGSAVLHHGSYATTILLVAGGAARLADWGRLGSALLGLNLVVFALGWLMPRAGIPVLGWSPVSLLLLASSSIIFFDLSRAWLRQTRATISESVGAFARESRNTWDPSDLVDPADINRG